jgi:hypothetical protein
LKGYRKVTKRRKKVFHIPKHSGTSEKGVGWMEEG